MFRFWAGTRTGSGGSFLFLLCLCKVFSATIEPEIHTEKTHGLPQAGPAPVQPYPGALILRQSEQQRAKNAKHKKERKKLQKTRRLQ